MAASITLFNNFSAENVHFSELKKNKLGGKFINLQGPAGDKLLIQMPAMRAPFGLSEFTDKGTGKVTYSLDLSLDDPEVRQLLEQIDSRVLNYVADNSVQFLGKPYKKEILQEALFKPMVKPGKGDYAPTLKLKVVTGRDGQFIPRCFEQDRSVAPLDSIDKGSQVFTIVELNQIWFIDSKFGVSVRLQQVMKLPRANLNEFAFAVEKDESVASDEIDAPIDA
ncbi:hypothetical protein EBT31_03710 [bacterium]|jgi:hypothetical protein|nr:hypothetical protein [bacterium]NBX48823.1 hypothetical protein [bacterium]